MRRTTRGSSIVARTRIRPPQLGQANASTEKTRWSKSAHRQRGGREVTGDGFGGGGSAGNRVGAAGPGGGATGEPGATGAATRSGAASGSGAAAPTVGTETGAVAAPAPS